MTRRVRFAAAVAIAVLVGLGVSGCAREPDADMVSVTGGDPGQDGTAVPGGDEGAATDAAGVPLADPFPQSRRRARPDTRRRIRRAHGGCGDR